MIPVDLAERCERYGIALRYRDFWGQEHEAPEETLRALLDAMAAQDAHDRATRVIVWRSDAILRELELDIATPASATSLHWHLALESGGRHDGDCVSVVGTDATHLRIRCGTGRVQLCVEPARGSVSEPPQSSCSPATVAPV